MDHVRKLMGLPPATNRTLSDGMEAAFDDVAAAFMFVRDNAVRYRVDTGRIAIGGFSAGGTSALYAVFACGVPAAGVIAISGRMEAADILHYVDGSKRVPIVQFVGEHDIRYVKKLSLQLREHCAKVGIENTTHHVPGFGHFYPQNAKTISAKGPESTVERAMLTFLKRTLNT
jgi:predicted esterase